MADTVVAEAHASLLSTKQTAGGLHLLDPATIRIVRPDSGFPNLVIREYACYERIRIVRCFPLSQAFEFISLRDRAGQEIGIIENLQDLDEESRRIAREELDKRYFVSEVIDIYSIRHRHGSVIFDVETNRGRRVFDVYDRHRNIVYLPGGRLFVVDDDGCQYSISNPAAMPNRARGQLYKIM